MMFTTMVTWMSEWDRDMLDVLRDPAAVAQEAPGRRRRWAATYARMGEVERMQLYEATLRWPFVRFVKATLILAGLLAAVGGLLHLVWPDLPLNVAVVSAEVLGFGLAAAAFFLRYYYRLFIRHKWKMAIGVVATAFAGAVTGLVANAVKHGLPILEVLAHNGPATARTVSIACAAFLLVVLGVSAWRNAGYEQLALKLHARAEQERLGRELTDTQLRLLRAQIEPHFLFNTLGAVQQLAERDNARAAAELTANLIAFLRSTAGGMRRESATLREEFELARAYLNVMKARLGERLEVALELPAELAPVHVPGMAVLTLAENAVKHGVEPARGPVRILLSAAREDGQVRVRVTDTGVGLSETPAGGMGLQNLRDRLRLAFGPAAQLHLYEQESGGVVAELALPVGEKVGA